MAGDELMGRSWQGGAPASVGVTPPVRSWWLRRRRRGRRRRAGVRLAGKSDQFGVGLGDPEDRDEHLEHDPGVDAEYAMPGRDHGTCRPRVNKLSCVDRWST